MHPDLIGQFVLAKQANVLLARHAHVKNTRQPVSRRQARRTRTRLRGVNDHLADVPRTA